MVWVDLRNRQRPLTRCRHGFTDDAGDSMHSKLGQFTFCINNTRCMELFLQMKTTENIISELYQQDLYRDWNQ